MIDTELPSSPQSVSTSTQTTATNTSSNSNTVSHLRRVLTPLPTAASTLLGFSSPRFLNLPVGSFIEVSPAAFKIARQVAQLISGTSESEVEHRKNLQKRDVAPGLTSSVGGCGLIVDYGGDKVYGDSFRVSSQFANPLWQHKF